MLSKSFSSVRWLMLLQYKFWFCLLSFLLLSSVTVTTASTVTATDAVPGLLAPWSFSRDRRKPTTASIVLITITNTLLCLITIFYCYCRADNEINLLHLLGGECVVTFVMKLTRNRTHIYAPNNAPFFRGEKGIL